MESTSIEVKPLSVNKVWQGRRFKTQDYKNYEELLMGLLPDDVEVPEGKLELHLNWGFSSSASDWDNPIKPFQDILQKKYDFNDNRVFRAIVEKEIVPKGEEYIEFLITNYEEKE